MRASKQRRVPRAAVRPALWLCACNLLAAALAGQCTNPTLVPNGTYTSGDHSQVDNNALAASNFAVSQGATATFVAANCTHLRPGFRANALGATVPTTFHAWVDIAPTAPWMVPYFAPENPPLSQSFTWAVSSPAGRSNLSHVFALFNTTSYSTANACYIHYDASSNLVWLADNTSTTWLGGFAPSSSGSIGNSQCTIAGTNSSPNPTTSGTQLDLTLKVTFNPASFSGEKNTYVYALDGWGVSTGWQQRGTWTVPAPPAPDFTLTAVTDTYFVQTGVPSTASYILTVTPQNGFNSPVSFSVPFSMYGCGAPSFNPAVVAGPSWTTTVTMSCNETAPGDFWLPVSASGGGRSHDRSLLLHVAPAQQYLLTTGVSPDVGGSISPATRWYSAGSYAPITATPASGYQFSSFAGVDSSNGSTGYVTMNGNRSVTATFTQTATSYTLTTNVSPAGAGSISPATGSYNAGPMTITATANNGYAFSSFTETYSGTTNPLNINLNGNGTITANFVPGYVISGQVTLAGTGTAVSGVGISASGSQTASATTDANGRYSLPGLAAGGSYTVAASKSGYLLSSVQSFLNPPTRRPALRPPHHSASTGDQIRLK